MAWAASNRSGVGAQVPTGQAATPPTAEQQQQAAQQQAAKQAAQQAAVAGHAGLPWARRGRPARLVIVRATSIDSVAAGHLVQRVVGTGGRCRRPGWMPRSRPRG